MGPGFLSAYLRLAEKSVGQLLRQATGVGLAQSQNANPINSITVTTSLANALSLTTASFGSKAMTIEDDFGHAKAAPWGLAQIS
jgi:hypothetical protein